MKDAEQMPMHYALAFLSEKADLLLKAKAKAKLEHERPKNTHAAPSNTTTKTYVSTKRVCQ